MANPALGYAVSLLPIALFALAIEGLATPPVAGAAAAAMPYVRYLGERIADRLQHRLLLGGAALVALWGLVLGTRLDVWFGVEAAPDGWIVGYELVLSPAHDGWRMAAGIASAIFLVAAVARTPERPLAKGASPVGAPASGPQAGPSEPAI